MDIEAIKRFLESGRFLCLTEKSKSELEEVFGHDFALMKGYWQNNPHHCYNLLEHTLYTLEALDLSGMSEEECLELKLAALYHDVGKTHVAFEKNGKTVFYNHAVKSKEIVEKELRAVGVSEYTVNKICFFVEFHDMFISFKMKEETVDTGNPYIREITTLNVKKAVDKVIGDFEKKGGYVPSYHDFEVLLRLCFADAEAQSETVTEYGKTVDGRAMKRKRLTEIGKALQG